MVFSFKNYLLFCNIVYLLRVPQYGFWLNKHAIRLRKGGVTPLTAPRQHFTDLGEAEHLGFVSSRRQKPELLLQQIQPSFSFQNQFCCRLLGEMARQDSGSQRACRKGMISSLYFSEQIAREEEDSLTWPKDSELQTSVSNHPPPLSPSDFLSDGCHSQQYTPVLCQMQGQLQSPAFIYFPWRRGLTVAS